MIHQVDNVEIDWSRLTVLVNDNKDDDSAWGMTLVPYINSQNIEIGRDIYNHESGHTMQSRILGPFYLTIVAIPSGLSAFYTYNIQNEYSHGNYHDQSWYEVWASRLGGSPRHWKEWRKNNFWYWLGIVTIPFPN
jgi:hypothetical protein